MHGVNMKSIKNNDIRITKSKNNMYQALVSLLQEREFEKITVIDICKRAKLNRMTFYNHYQDKYDLFNDLLKLVLNDLYNHYNNLAKDLSFSKNTYECLKIFATILVDLVYDNQTLVHNIFKNEDSLASYILKTTINETFMKVVDTSGIKQKNNFPIPLIVSFFSGGTGEAFSYWLNHKDEITKEEFLDYLCRGIKAVTDTNILSML